jgi:hypothetical protein
MSSANRQSAPNSWSTQRCFLNDLFVEDVPPAADCGHLLVHVVIPVDRSVTEALSALRSRSAAPPFGGHHGHHPATLGSGNHFVELQSHEDGASG